MREASVERTRLGPRPGDRAVEMAHRGGKHAVVIEPRLPRGQRLGDPAPHDVLQLLRRQLRLEFCDKPLQHRRAQVTRRAGDEARR
jgi:hypothetical protein